MHAESNTLVDVKRAVSKARDYLAEMLQIPPERLLLEEVELSEDDKFWLVTLSFPPPAGSSFAVALGGRVYKVVKIDAVTGEFESIKIRQV
jgi:hypothetical protein